MLTDSNCSNTFRSNICYALTECPSVTTVFHRAFDHHLQSFQHPAVSESTKCWIFYGVWHVYVCGESELNTLWIMTLKLDLLISHQCFVNIWPVIPSIIFRCAHYGICSEWFSLHRNVYESIDQNQMKRTTICNVMWNMPWLRPFFELQSDQRKSEEIP